MRPVFYESPNLDSHVLKERESKFATLSSLSKIFSPDQHTNAYLNYYNFYLTIFYDNQKEYKYAMHR